MRQYVTLNNVKLNSVLKGIHGCFFMCIIEVNGLVEEMVAFGIIAI